jgi:hypothetical protein
MTEQSFLHCPATLVNTEDNYQVTDVRIYGLFPILSKTNIMYSFSQRAYRGLCGAPADSQRVHT